MATLQETVQAVLAELQKQGTNLQDTSIAGNANDFDLLLGFKNGGFVRIPTNLMPNDLSEEDKANLDRSFYNVLQEIQDDYVGFWFMANRTDGVEIFIPAATENGAGVMSGAHVRDINQLHGDIAALVGAIESAQDEFRSGITNESNARTSAIKKVNSGATQASSIHFSANGDNVALGGRTLDGSGTFEEIIPIATNVNAGVLSPKDKSFIDSIAQSEEVDDIDDAVLLIVGKSDGTFVRVSPSVLRGVTTQYLTKSDYDNLVALGGIKDNVEYNIIENE